MEEVLEIPSVENLECQRSPTACLERGGVLSIIGKLSGKLRIAIATLGFLGGTESMVVAADPERKNNALVGASFEEVLSDAAMINTEVGTVNCGGSIDIVGREKGTHIHLAGNGSEDYSCHRNTIFKSEDSAIRISMRDPTTSSCSRANVLEILKAILKPIFYRKYIGNPKTVFDSAAENLVSMRIGLYRATYLDVGCHGGNIYVGGHLPTLKDHWFDGSWTLEGRIAEARENIQFMKRCRQDCRMEHTKCRKTSNPQCCGRLRFEHEKCEKLHCPDDCENEYTACFNRCQQ